MRCRRLFVTFLLVVFTILLPTVSCTEAQPSPALPWAAGDLRFLDPAGNASEPAIDILAVYLRATPQDIQVRVDLLDLTIDDDYQLVVSVHPQGRWAPFLLLITPDEVKHFLSNGEGMIPVRVVRDPWLDTITLSFNRFILSEQTGFLAATFLPEEPLSAETLFADRLLETAQNATGNLHLRDEALSRRAPALIAFTYSFPAATPAQAFRRWDGAHTGPNGERHGLKHVLAGVRAYRIPVILADIKTPTSLAALDFLGVTGDLQQLVKDELLILPEVVLCEPADMALESSRHTAVAFDLPASPFVYAAEPGILPLANPQFMILADTNHILLSNGRRLIPISPGEEAPQATNDGPSLAIRKALIEAAFTDDPADLVVMGGSLPASTWGDSDMAAASFAWLAAHPWVQILDGRDLRRFPTVAMDIQTSQKEPASEYLSILETAGNNAIGDSAWQAYFMLAAPADSPELQQLKANYLGQIGILTAASIWADHPYSFHECSLDLDHDLVPECILANEHYFAVVATDGARLTHLFFGEHQLVGPTAQLSVGLSDASQWDLSRGDGADPGQTMGIVLDHWEPNSPHSSDWSLLDVLTLESNDGSRKISFQLTEDGLQITVKTREAVSLQIPLIVDPQMFFLGSSVYRANLSTDSWTWGPEGGIQVRVRTDAPLSAQGFTVSLPFIGYPENPDLDYPPGHYYPFPLSLVEILVDGNITIQINVQE